jgi:membrane fusion protein, multidrug efflux system
MKAKPNPNSISIDSMGIVVITLLMLTLLVACQKSLDKDDAQHQADAKKGPAQISVESGQAVLTLEPPAQNRVGLELVTLTVTVSRLQSTSSAVVLPVQDLATFRNSYVAIQAQLQKSRAEAEVARKESARLKTLFEDNQNISEKSLQSAEGTLQANEADVHAGEQQLNLQESVVRQEWGSVAGKWAIDGSPEFQRILEQQEVLVQVTIPSGAPFEAPRNISLDVPGGAQAKATFVSTFPRVDPRIQGRSFLYRALAQPGLTPGVNLLAHLSMGNPMRGVIVPSSAVVWSEGKAWVYQQTASDRFTRRAVAIDTPVEQGFFIAEGFSPGDRIVTQGAQALLSEELLLHGQAGGANDEE